MSVSDSSAVPYKSRSVGSANELLALLRFKLANVRGGIFTDIEWRLASFPSEVATHRAKNFHDPIRCRSSASSARSKRSRATSAASNCGDRASLPVHRSLRLRPILAVLFSWRIRQFAKVPFKHPRQRRGAFLSFTDEICSIVSKQFSEGQPLSSFSDLTLLCRGVYTCV